MNQRQNKTTEVLIVGAGPTGLMMACQLAFHGIPFRIIDKKDYRTNYSGALIIQARSMEIFHQMGVAQKALQNGIIANEIIVLFNGKKSFRIPLKDIGQGLTKFPYLFMIEQSVTEKLLTDFISKHGYAVERNTELLRLSQENGVVNAILKLPEGKEDILKAKYLVATDGGHSTVREQLAIPFLGSTHEISLFVTDCKAEVDLPADTICFSFSNKATTGFFPLIQGRWRIDGIIPKELKTKNTLVFDDIAGKFSQRTRMRIKIHYPEWFSVFHSHQRYAASFQQNRCFLLGDAAHIHSPVGAQGMNTGMQDAYNLAWKLAMVIQKKAKESLLKTYASEREGIAKKVIQSTDLVFRLVTSMNLLVRAFRIHAVPLIMRLILPALKKQKFTGNFFFSMISEIGVQYRKSPLSYNATIGNFPSHSPKPGDRLPYIIFNEGGKPVNIQDKVDSKGFYLFIFAKKILPYEFMLAFEKYKHLLFTEIIPYSSETICLYERFGIKNTGCFLIRPDMYIAYRSAILTPEHFESYLQQYLINS